MVVRAVEDRDVGEVAAFVDESFDALKDEVGLRAGIHDRHEVGLFAVGFYGAQLFVVTFACGLAAEDGIGKFENLGGAAVVGFDLVDLGSVMTLVEAHDVVEVRAAPGVDALRVVTDGHDLVVHAKDIDDVGLEAVCVLKLVDEDVFEALLVDCGDVRVFAQEFQEVFEQVVVVDHLLLELGGLIGFKNVGDLLRHAVEEGEMIVSFVVNAAAGVARVADHIGDDFGLRVVLALDKLWVDGVDGVFEKALGLAFVENCVVALESDRLPVHAEDALGDTVEGATPELTTGNHGEVLDAFEHFAGCFVGESQQQDLVGLDALVE